MKNKIINLLAVIILSNIAMAEFAGATSLKAIAGVGVYHRVDRFTHYKMLERDAGSETPASVKLGLRISDCTNWYCMGTSNIDLVYRHQSYIDKGAPFNDKQETFIDMVGVEFEWSFEIKRW
jgi:hypothetical protein